MTRLWEGRTTTPPTGAQTDNVTAIMAAAAEATTAAVASKEAFETEAAGKSLGLTPTTKSSEEFFFLPSRKLCSPREFPVFFSSSVQIGIFLS